MADNLVCSFCTKKGIIGPHGHTIRNWSSKDKEIICPQLLSNHCTYCGELGHTKNYCEKIFSIFGATINNKITTTELKIKLADNLFL